MSLPDLTRVRFSLKEFRRTPAIEDATVLLREPLATELEFTTLIADQSDAETFGEFILSMRSPGRNTWTIEHVRGAQDFLIGDTITAVHPRLGLVSGRNFIVKGSRRDSGLTETLTLYGPV